MSGQYETDEQRDERWARYIRLWKQRVKIFSDSIFIFFDGEEQKKTSAAEFIVGSKQLCMVAAFISRRLWELAIPHRGAIAFGQCFLSPDGTVFLGDPIVRAQFRMVLAEDSIEDPLLEGFIRAYEQAERQGHFSALARYQATASMWLDFLSDIHS